MKNKGLVKRLLLLLFVTLAQFGKAQDLYDMHTLREMTIKFYDPNYQQVLIDRFNTEDDTRLSARLEMNWVKYDSVRLRHKVNISFLS